MKHLIDFRFTSGFTRSTAARLLLLSCCIACDPAPPVGQSDVIVRSPVNGDIWLEGRAIPIRANRATSIQRVRTGPMDISLNWDEGIVSVLSFSGSEVDFSALVDRPPLLQGRTVTTRFRPRPSEGFESVVISGGQAIRPTLEDGLLIFRVPDYADATLIGIWREGEHPVSMVVEALGLPSARNDRIINVEPELSLDAELAVQVDVAEALSLPGWLTSELTFGGIRTGLSLVSGLVSSQEALAIPRPSQDVVGMGIWATIQHRGWAPAQGQARLEAHLSITRSEARLEWSLPLGSELISPGGREPDLAETLIRDEERPTGEVVNLRRGWTVNADRGEYSWLEIRLRTLGTCSPLDWRVFAPPTTELNLPEFDAFDPLDAPLILGEVNLVDEQGIGFDDFISGHRDRRFVQQVSAIKSVRGSAGYWLGSAPRDCTEGLLRGQHFFYADELNCDEERLAPEVLFDRCGRLIPLKPDVLTAPWCEGRLTGDRFMSRSGGQGDLVPNGEGYQLEVDGARLTIIARPEPTVSRPDGWFRNAYEYRIIEQSHEYFDGVVGRPINSALLIGVGSSEGGPWLTAEADGVLQFRTPLMNFDAHLGLDDLGEERLEVLGHSCPEEPRYIDVANEGDSLVLTEELASARPGEIRVRTATFTP